MVTLWSATDYSHLLNWQNELSTSYINCLAWNPIRTNEFCLGSSHGTIHFCSINEPTDDPNPRLKVLHGQIPLILNEHTDKSCDITACVYVTSAGNLVLCATNSGFITCWNSRLCLCVLHWKADLNEICYMTTIKHKLLTGSSTGCLRLWNIENLEMTLGELNSIDS
jgi:WD40 repeat protein